MTGAFAAEWCKLRTARSTAAVLGTVAVFLLLCVLWSWYVTRYWDGLSAARRETARAAPAEQPLVLALPVCAVLLGTFALASEYASGMNRTTLTALPRRLPLFAAKAGVAAGTVLAAALASLTAAVLAGRAVVGDRAVPAFHGAAGEQAAHLLWVGLSAASTALIAVGVGAVLRSAAATIAVGIALQFVAPVLAGLLPAPWDDRVGSLLPDALPGQIAAAPASPGDPGVLPAPAAAALMAGYAAVALGAGALAFARRDA